MKHSIVHTSTKVCIYIGVCTVNLDMSSKASEGCTQCSVSLLILILDNAQVSMCLHRDILTGMMLSVMTADRQKSG